MRIIEYLQKGGEFFDSDYTFPEWLDSDTQEHITNILALSFGLRNIQKRAEVMGDIMDRDIWEVVPMLVYTLVMTRDYAWKTLLETESFEYNPIENYDRTENEGITRNIGAQAISQIKAALTITRTDPAHIDTVTRKVSAENESDYQPDEQTESSYAEVASTESTPAHTDQIQNGAREDGEGRELHVHGNIGVLSSQTLIKEQREIANFSAIYEIAHEIANEIGEGVF